mgnify:CR=1 FL=1
MRIQTGAVIAILVLIFSGLMAAGIVPMTPGWVGGLLAALAISRLS